MHAPASKSETLRGLVAATLAGGGTLTHVATPWPADVHAVIAALKALGAEIDVEEDVIRVIAGLESTGEPVTISAGDGAAPARFLLALAATTGRPVTITGEGRLPERPMGPLLAALRSLGARVDGGPGLPVTVQGPLQGGRRLGVDGRASSQFVSALLLVAPAVPGGLALRSVGRQVSRPYIDLTRDVMAAFGAGSDGGLDALTDQTYVAGRTYAVGADWSGATALLAAAPLLGRPVFVPSLRTSSVQPDRAFAEVLTAIGVDVVARDGGLLASGSVDAGGTFDLGEFPDSAPALAALAAAGSHEVRIEGAAHLRHKESDRIAALVALLEGVGLEAEELRDGLRIMGGPLARAQGPPVRLPVRGDHRIAMTAALLGLRRPVLIDDETCVAKSFPAFFDQWPGVVDA